MKVIDINLKAEYTSAYLALYYFRIPPTSGHKSLKSLIFISSLAGYTDLPWASGYNAAKMGVRGIWKSLRSGIGALGIRSNLIAPWFVHTPMTDPIIGLLKGSGMVFATVDGVVEAVVRCAVDETIQSKSLSG
jgi:5'-hydroxyaverantin dehydrogenase